MKKTILFLCTHNSARSQLAEGLCNHYHGDQWVAHSAGTEETIVKPWAIESMKRAGIDISHHRSKVIDEFKGQQFDVVVTVCDNAKEACPFFPGKKVVHHSFVDPSGRGNNDEELVESFSKTRDEIKVWLDEVLPTW